MNNLDNMRKIINLLENPMHTQEDMAHDLAWKAVSIIDNALGFKGKRSLQTTRAQEALVSALEDYIIIQGSSNGMNR